MKKLSLLISLILCVTIGGVYAAWHYAGTSAGGVHHHINNISLADINTETTIGTYSVKDGDDNVLIQIDQKSQVVGAYDYDTVLKITGSI